MVLLFKTSKSELSASHFGGNLSTVFRTFISRRCLMTRMQVEAQKLSEQIRNNRMVEELTRVRDANTAEYQRAQIAIGEGNLAETRRANQAKESFNLLSLGETQRHNLASESQAMQQLLELRRHNLAGEEYNTLSLQETQRANLAKEAETSRSNQARETETRRSNLANERLGQERNRETERANRASEFIRNAANAETHRANLESESIRRQGNAIQLMNVEESRRAHLASEEINRSWNEQQLKLKQRELEDRYFWQDKANQALERIFGEDLNVGGFINEKANKLEEWVNRRDNRGETWWKTKVEIPLRTWTEETVAPKVDQWAAGVRDFLGLQ